MADQNEKIDQLKARLDKMVEYQDYFYREINQIRDELKALRTFEPTGESIEPPMVEKVVQPTEPSAYKPPIISSTPSKTPVLRPPSENRRPSNAPYAPPRIAPTPRRDSGLEEFVGKNLLSLIGIIITVIGVGIGAKYAIDRDLISPSTRILLGYAFAGGLLAVAFWLKSKYLNFSAVLLSGALAMMYFLTFFAYSFYGLIPQIAAFVLMLFFTAFTVGAAINFNRQVIAHIGLVGAYAVPFLLSDNSGRVGVLFTYMTIINFGILAISIVKFWKPLFYSSFVFTWLIYAAWYFLNYRPTEQFNFALGFAVVFFLTFYATFLIYKLRAKEEFSAEIVCLVLVNSFVFYGFGYSILERRDGYDLYLGLFTVANALLNALVAFIIHRYNLGERKNFYLAVALAITFITIAVPVQFDSNWVTLIWTAEAAMMFWFGRTKNSAVYENLSYPLMILASLSLLDDWRNAFDHPSVSTLIFNRGFLTSILFAVAFAFITAINRDKIHRSVREDAAKMLDFFAPTLFFVVLYNAFRLEISGYFYTLAENSAVRVPDSTLYDGTLFRLDNAFDYFSYIWQINYSMLFLTVLSFVNLKKVKSAYLGLVNLALNTLVLFVFLSVSLYLIGELRASYLAQSADVSYFGALSIYIRYISYAFAASLIYASFRYIKQRFFDELADASSLKLAFDFVFFVVLLWILSSELINLMDIFGFNESYKLGLSILWGIYSVLLIVVGIVKRKSQLRIGAIVLFAVTLVKLFFYDIADLDTISKTVIFLTLGILLLVISFLYNKYKDLIFEKNAEQ